MPGAAACFGVTDPRAPRYAVQRAHRRDHAADRVARSVGHPAAVRADGGLWQVRPGYNDPGTSVVVNAVPYARFVEYGTRRTRAYAMLGRALASG